MVLSLYLNREYSDFDKILVRRLKFWFQKRIMLIYKQEAQLMLTTDSTRLAVSRGQQTWYHVTYSFLLCNSNFVFKTRRFYDIRLQKIP